MSSEREDYKHALLLERRYCEKLGRMAGDLKDALQLIRWRLDDVRANGEPHPRVTECLDLISKTLGKRYDDMPERPEV